VHLPSDLDYHTVFTEVFHRHLREASLLSVETLGEGNVVELVYSVELRPRVTEATLVDALRPLVRNHKVAILVGQENINV
jgi:hypothetical protein